MEKTVAVKLTARTTQYMAAMAAASKATTGLATSASGLTKVGSSMQSVGANMTRYVSVPLVALGGAATLMASRFETSFAQMVGLANVPASEIDGLRESVLSLAGETAQAPQDLADALYFAASSGLDSAAALDAVEIAARAAAAGMGSTETVVGLLTGAVGSYGAANLTAAEAADILTSTVREGRAAPEELAGALGRVLPIAASMGISMNEVGAAIAFMTNKGLDADEAVTGLRGVLTHLAAPGAAARKTLEDMGTSATELKAAIDADGLMGALELLREHGFNGNAQALHGLMPEVRGLNTLTALLADNSGSLDQIMGRLNDTTGSLDTAFAAVADTSGFKMKQAFAQIQTALIQIGDVLLPFVASAASAIGDLAGWFSDLPAPIQQVATALAAMAAIGGPVIFMAGSLLKSWQTLSTAFSASTGIMGTLTGALGLIGLAAGAGFLIYRQMTKDQRETDTVTRSTSEALDGQVVSLFSVAGAAEESAGKIDGVTIANEALAQSLAIGNDDLSASLAEFNVGAADTLDLLLQYGEQPVWAVQALGEAYGMTSLQAQEFASAAIYGLGSIPLDDFLAEVGLTREEWEMLNGALADFGDAADHTDLNAIAKSFLDGRVQAEGYEGSLVAAAEAEAGFNRQTGDAVAIYQIWGRLIGEADTATRSAALGVDELGAAVSSASSFAERGTELFSGYWTSFEHGSKSFAGGMSEVVDGITSAAEAQEALNRIAATPMGESWVGQAERMTGASRNGKDAVLVYRALRAAVDAAAQGFPELIGQLGMSENSLLASGKGAEYVAAEFSKAGGAAKVWAGTLDVVKRAAGQVGDAATEAGNALYSMSTRLPTAADRFERLQDAAGGLRDAFDVLMTPADDLRGSVRGVWTEMDNMSDAIDENGTALNEMGNDWDVTTKEGRAMQEQTEATRDAILEHGVAMMENGHTADEAAADIAFNVLALNDQWRAAGKTEEEIAALNAQYGLTPEQINTAILLAGAANAKHTAQDYINFINKIPSTVSTTVTAYAKTGNARTAIDRLTYAKSVAITPYLTKTSFGIQIHASGTGFLKSAAGRYIPGGSNLLTTTAEIGGRRGDEVILPLGDRSRMSALLGMSEVGPRVAAAFGGDGGRSSGGMSSAVYNTYNSVEVKMPPGSNGDDVIRALRKWQRQSGPLPLVTR